jgi:hypothetical protein
MALFSWSGPSKLSLSVNFEAELMGALTLGAAGNRERADLRLSI